MIPARVLLWKYSHSESEDLLKELKSTVLNLEAIASEKNSYSLLAETYFLHSQLLLIELETKKSKDILRNALQIAENKGLNKLAIKISNEYDNLLDKLDLWEDFTSKLPTIAEKMELTHIESQLDKVIRGRLSADAEIEVEYPVMFLMLDKNKRVIYSERYDKNLKQETIDNIHQDIIKCLKEGEIEDKINRAKIQEYNCIFANEYGLLMSYLFIGKSYSGSRKLHNLVDLIESKEDIKNMLSIVAVSDKTLNFNERIKLTELLDEVLMSQNGPIMT